MRFLKEHQPYRVDIIVLLLILLIGLIRLPQPFMGDQALSAMMGAKLGSGGVIYRDLWDLKQPGIFAFYFVAGKVFGFDEIGIHTFELMYMVGFSLVLIMALKDSFRQRFIASLVPLLTVGVYYSLADIWHQTQTEALVGFPLFLSLWLAGKSLQGTHQRAAFLFSSGLMGGIVLLFKFMFFPIVATFWLSAVCFTTARSVERIPEAALKLALPILLGVSLPLFAMFAYFARHGIVDLAFWTFVEHPLHAMAAVDLQDRIGTLVDGLMWFINGFAPLFALSLVGACARQRSRKTYITLNLALWVVVGFGVILAQRLSWWQYHYFLLSVPVGILAAYGLDTIWTYLTRTELQRRGQRIRIVAAASFVLLFLPLVGSVVLSSLHLARYGLALDIKRRLRYQSASSPKYEETVEEVAFLADPRSLGGEIYVVGTPLFYYLSGRDPAAPFLATWFWPDAELWAQLLQQLDTGRPVYVFIHARDFAVTRSVAPQDMDDLFEAILQMIEHRYRVLRTSDAGTWYVLRNS